MFGYITPMTEELKVRENELYKSIYCGLCSAMGEHICTSNRLTLSYDIVFLALVRACVTGENVSVKKKRCMVHPIIPKNRANIPETLKYCASASALLTYYKVLDDINDKPTLKARLKQPGARRFRKKAGLSSLDRVIATHLAELSSLEKSGGSLDRNADCFGRVLGEVFSYGLDCPELRDMGVHIGRWIYIIDAAEDLEKDRKSGEYNPLSCYDVLPKEAVAVACTLELEAAYNAFNSIEVKNTELKPIINNILTLGMPRAQDKITGDKND